MKENEFKEKRRYVWCASKKKNTNAARGVAGEPGHGGLHHHTRLQHSVNDARHDLGSSHWRAPPTCDGQRRLLPWLRGVVLRVPLRPHPIDTPQVQTLFLEEDDHRCERKVVSSKTRFQELSGGREDADYKENTWTFWKVILSRRKFQFFTY